MIPLARWAAIPGEHTRLTHLQTEITAFVVLVSMMTIHNHLNPINFFFGVL